MLRCHFFYYTFPACCRAETTCYRGSQTRVRTMSLKTCCVGNSTKVNILYWWKVVQKTPIKENTSDQWKPKFPLKNLNKRKKFWLNQTKFIQIDSLEWPPLRSVSKWKNANIANQSHCSIKFFILERTWSACWPIFISVLNRGGGVENANLYNTNLVLILA